MQAKRLVPPVVWLILAAALALRLFGAARANLIFDERAHLALAETIDLRWGHLHLVSRTLDHPLLSIYVLKLSSLLFGRSDFALRLLHVLAGTATVVPVYWLGRRVFSEQAGLWGAALLAVDQFHASWSRVFMPEVLMLLFAAWALVVCLRSLSSGRLRDYALLGGLLGAAYLSKESAVLLIPAIWVYLLITPTCRRLLLRPHWYLAQAVFLLVVAPDLIWNLSLGTESYLYRDLVFVSAPAGLSLKSLSLYLYEIFSWWWLPAEETREYFQGNVYACHWLSGVLYLAAVAAAVSRRGDRSVRLLLVVFLVVLIFFLVVPGGRRCEPFWWASLSLIPAVVCAGWMLQSAAGGSRVACLAGLALLVYLGVACLGNLWRAGPYEPRATVADFVRDFSAAAHAALDRGALDEAQNRFIYILNIGGPNADAYYGLGLVAQRRGRAQQAQAMALRCLQLDPSHQQAVELLEETSPKPR